MVNAITHFLPLGQGGVPRRGGGGGLNVKQTIQTTPITRKTPTPPTTQKTIIINYAKTEDSICV